MPRPRRPLLDHDLIIDAALDLIDAEGPAGLTVRGVAGALGVQAASLYHHVDGMAGILDGIRARLTRAVVVAGWDDLAWDEAVDAVARAYHAALLPHPGVVPLLVAHPVTDDLTAGLYVAFADKLVAGGWSTPDARSIVALVEAYVLGAALAALDPSNDEPGPPLADRFGFGLDVVLAGLRLRHPTSKG